MEIHDKSILQSVLNAHFIAHAREDVPALVAEVERLKIELEAACTVNNTRARKRNCVEELKKHIAPIFDEHGQYNGSKVDKDLGQIARQALGGEGNN